MERTKKKKKKNHCKDEEKCSQMGAVKFKSSKIPNSALFLQAPVNSLDHSPHHVSLQLKTHEIQIQIQIIFNLCGNFVFESLVSIDIQIWTNMMVSNLV